jgi:hypothetical protein
VVGLRTASCNLADGIFRVAGGPVLAEDCTKIGRSMSIIPETKQISIPRNSPLKSRAQISDGLGDGSSSFSEEICAEKSARYDS